MGAVTVSRKTDCYSNKMEWKIKLAAADDGLALRASNIQNACDVSCHLLLKIPNVYSI